MRPSSKLLSCREADPLALRFLKLLHTAGGSPAKIQKPKFDLSRPDRKSDFTYYGPGDLIENSGWKKMPGRAGIREVAVLYALGRLLPHRNRGTDRTQGRAISLQTQQ
jgi:hypothetical protein